MKDSAFAYFKLKFKTECEHKFNMARFNEELGKDREIWFSNLFPNVDLSAAFSRIFRDQDDFKKFCETCTLTKPTSRDLKYYRLIANEMDYLYRTKISYDLEFKPLNAYQKTYFLSDVDFTQFSSKTLFQFIGGRRSSGKTRVVNLIIKILSKMEESDRRLRNLTKTN